MKDAQAEARRWLAQAADDLEAARILAERERYAQACFLAQQAGEKALKGYLYAAGADAVLGHSVATLCEEAARRAPALAERCREWATLDQFYIPTRYPDALPGGIPADIYTETHAEDAVALAASLVATIAGELGDEE